MHVSNGFYQRLIIGSSGEEFRVFPSVSVPASSKLTTKPRLVRNVVYLVVIGWLYVVLMMSVAEASNTTGTVLGAIVTFFLYGLIPIALVVYLMRTPQRRKELKAREAAEDLAYRTQATENAAPVSDPPDAGGHAAGAAQTDSVPAVRKET
jgi:hypothetical protein